MVSRFVSIQLSICSYRRISYNVFNFKEIKYYYQVSSYRLEFSVFILQTVMPNPINNGLNCNSSPT